MSDNVLRLSCRSISLKRWQIFLMTNWQSAMRRMLPSWSGTFYPVVSACQRTSFEDDSLRMHISGVGYCLSVS